MVTALKQLLTAIVDYAGLFPPAQLGMLEAMRMYDRARTSPHAWMLDRFVLPASRLSEFVALLPGFVSEHQPSNASRRWSLSVILSKNWATELAQIDAITNAKHPIEITAWEIAPLSPTAIQSLCNRLPGSITPFFEIPFDVDLQPYVVALQQTGAAAKLRTGGITSTAFPNSTQLSQRILALAHHHIPFKATAGLHHPLRGDYRLTYIPGSDTATMHGFLNLTILTALAHQRAISPDEAIALLETPFLDAFQFTDTELQWRDRVLSLAAIQHSRQQFFYSFGSCSCHEPINDLQQLGLISCSLP